MDPPMETQARHEHPKAEDTAALSTMPSDLPRNLPERIPIQTGEINPMVTDDDVRHGGRQPKRHYAG
jgi:hypothetical protein